MGWDDDLPSYDYAPDFRARLLDDVSSTFPFGLACGSAYHFLRGVVYSPRGGSLAGGAHAVAANAPRVAGRFAAFFGISCAVDSALALARGRDDDWNSIAAIATTWGLLNAHRGARAAARSTLVGGGVTMLICGFCIWANTVLEMSPGDPRRPAPVAHPLPRPIAGGFLGIPPPPGPMPGPQIVVLEVPSAFVGLE
ncbi:hypothetical protein ACP4OV_012672 [Aristida adscensionis]